MEGTISVKVAGRAPSRGGFFFKVEINLRAHVHRDAKNCAALEGPGRLVFLAHGVAAVASDAEAIARQRELAGLDPHVSLGDALVAKSWAWNAGLLSELQLLLAEKFHETGARAFRRRYGSS